MAIILLMLIQEQQQSKIVGMEKKCALTLRGLPRNSVARINGCPDMT